MSYCPECSASVPDGAAACPTCGASLVSTPADAAEPSPVSASDIELVTADLRNSVRPQYELLRVLGTGGMGAVFLMREPALKRLVAVKVLAPWLAADPKARARFEREARAAAALSHPNVVRVYAEGETLGLKLPYIVMQYVDGPTLTEWIEKHQRASEREARRILGEVAAALAAAHARQLVHRDVKPSNILVEHETGRAYVVDFGVSAALNPAESDTTNLTATGTVPGTPIYMSPEQASGEGVTPKSDVYSLGVLAYELLVGELPYQARTAMGWAAAHLHDTPTPVRVHRADLAPEVATIVDRCLAKRPGERPTAEEVARGLLPGIESEIEWPPPGLHWMRGRGTVLGRLGALATGGALLTLTALFLTPPILRAHGNWLWRFQLQRAASATDPSSVPLFVWQTALALGIAIFALGAVTFLGAGTKLLARVVRLRHDGWHWTTLADLAADRDGRSGSIVSGAREFASLDAPARAAILRTRRWVVAWRTAAGLWIAAGLCGWVVALALASPSESRGTPVVTLLAWLLIAVPPIGVLAMGTAARVRERLLTGPLSRSRRAGDTATDASRWYRGLPGGGEPAAPPHRLARALARTAELAAVVLGLTAVVAITQAAVAGVAAVIFTQRLGPKTVAFVADQARLSTDDPMRTAQRAVRAFLPRGDDEPPAGSPTAWLRGLLRHPEAGGFAAYPVAPATLVPEPDALLHEVVEGERKLPADTLELLTALGAHQRTAFFRRLARYGALDSLFTPRRYRTGRRPPSDTLDMEPVRTPFDDAALANVAGAIAAAARHHLDSAAARLGENAALAEALLRVPQPRVNQIAARLLGRTALAPLATIAAARGDAAGAAQLADAAQRMAGAIPVVTGVAGLAVDPKDLIQFTGAVLSPRVPAGYRVEWMVEGWAGLCANPWELLAGPSATRRDAIAATADLAADVPHARDLALSAGAQWSYRMSQGRNRIVAWLADRSPWGLVTRIRECAGVI
jgi:predicted Ser/Thr protein kinase